jgi:multiple sugar transport system permease protein
MTFSVLFTFTDFQLIYVLTRGGPVNATASDGHAVVPARHPRAGAGRGRGDRVAMVPFLLAAIMFSYFGLQRRAWQQGANMMMSAKRPKTDSRMDFLRQPAAAHGHRSTAACCLRVRAAVPVLLDGRSPVKPEQELLSRLQPVLGRAPTLEHIKKLLFDTAYPSWLWNTMLMSVVATFLSLVASGVRGLRHRAAALQGLAPGDRLAIFLAYLVPPSILFIPLADVVFKLGLFDTPLALILTYPTFLIPFCTWLLMGYFRSIPYELEECALIDGASRWQILVKIVLPLAVPGLISAGIFAFTLCWNEFIYALTFMSSSENKTVPVGVLTELVDGDVYHWGALMAGALLGSLPVAILYSFFVEYYVSGR